MCQNCVIESGVTPIVNDQVRACVELIRQVYEYHSAGGYAHIVFDDYNIEDGHIDGCIQDAINGTLDHLYSDDDQEWLSVAKPITIEALKVFKALSESERYGALMLVDGYEVFQNQTT